MRHGRLASALALAGFTGLAAAQAPNTNFASDREPEAPAAVTPAALGLPTSLVAADKPAADKKTDDKKAPPARMPMPTSAAGSASPGATGATTPPPVSVIPPTLSALPPGGVLVPPAGGIVLPWDGGPTYFGGAFNPMSPSRYWVSAEYLAWRIKKDQAPPLVTTGPASFPVAFLGNPGTTVLFPGQLDAGTLSGMRLSGGLWLDDCQTVGLVASGFWLQESTNTTSFNSSQFPVLARPFNNVNPGGPYSEFLAFPGLATGSIGIQNTTQFCGASLAATCPLWGGCCAQVNGLAGLQYLNLSEQLAIVETPRSSPTFNFPPGPNTQYITTDFFKTRNQFYGGFVGANAFTYFGNWVLGANAQIGAGVNHETVDINGMGIVTPAGGGSTVNSGGLLALPGANIGRFTKNEFSVVSQLGVNLGYQITSNLQVFAGYTFLYWNRVVRPGSEIDPVLDMNRIPNFGTYPPATSHRPVVPFEQTSFWAQGVSVGLRLSW